MSQTKTGRRSRLRRWPQSSIVAGGLGMAALWPLFISLHGPTSYNRNHHLLGKSPEFWGSMMEGPAYLLIALGLCGLHRFLTQGRDRRARIGFSLTIFGLVATAVADLALLAIVPPLMSPFVGVGLILLALGHKGNVLMPEVARRACSAVGLLLLASFLWTAALPISVFDQVNGYAVYGFAANLLAGLGWAVIGASLRDAAIR